MKFESGRTVFARHVDEADTSTTTEDCGLLGLDCILTTFDSVGSTSSSSGTSQASPELGTSSSSQSSSDTADKTFTTLGSESSVQVTSASPQEKPIPSPSPTPAATRTFSTATTSTDVNSSVTNQNGTSSTPAVQNTTFTTKTVVEVSSSDGSIATATESTREISKPFWKNDIAVGGVFGSVGVVILIAIFALVYVKKRRRGSQMIRSGSALGTSVVPFMDVKEERRRGMFDILLARTISNRVAVGERPEEAVGVSSPVETEPPTYSEVLGQLVSPGTSSLRVPGNSGQSTLSRKGSGSETIF
ncbi:hypothetical protein SCHPADRAFT_935194 [Schizopora paradoxa]|uniref:Mid2 domain-containing protein n=1 Tax=Schizopora paradoxa TaxID=27342 RepID=A0A0H2SD73_9AGAM|nr:hypothetical protein SCHPADRAFT_935194 [Schizopora paradoxa]